MYRARMDQLPGAILLVNPSHCPRGLQTLGNRGGGDVVCKSLIVKQVVRPFWLLLQKKILHRIREGVGEEGR